MSRGLSDRVAARAAWLLRASQVTDLQELWRDPDLPAFVRGLPAGAFELLVLTLRERRLYDLLLVESDWAQWFAEDPAEFGRVFFEFLSSVPTRSLDPQADAAEFRAYLEFWR